MLNDMFTVFDQQCDKFGVYKVETIGGWQGGCSVGLPSTHKPPTVHPHLCFHRMPRTLVCTRLNKYMHTYTCKYTHKHTNAHTHTHAHTHARPSAQGTLT